MGEIKIKNGNISLVKGDITDLEVESFVFYAQHDLKLGSGFGNAISVRGGPSIQEELTELGTRDTCDVVITKGGELKAKYILHAVGPRFMEEDMEDKLNRTIENCLRLAEEKGLKEVVFPPMGTGFYGVPLEMSAMVSLSAFKNYLSNGGSIENLKICLVDNREYNAFEDAFSALLK